MEAFYHGTAPTITTGNQANIELDVNGNLKQTLATLIAGEDLTNNVLRVEQHFSYTNIVAAGTTTVKNGAGFVHLGLLGSTTAAAGTLYDSVGTSGTIIWQHKASIAEGAFPLDVVFSTGLTYANPGTPQITWSWR